MKIVVLLLAILVNCAHQAPRSQGGNNYGIFGGRNATDGQFPYQTSIYWCYNIPFPGDNCDQLCGGAIISPSWIVTAAQCYYWHDYYYNEMHVGVGYTDASKKNYKFFLKSVRNTFVHEDYVEGEEPSNDIRLYQLNSPLTFTELIQPIKLPKQNSDFTGEAVATGWGYSSRSEETGKKFPAVLRYQVSNMPNGERCAALASAVDLKNFSVVTNVCTESSENGQGTCSIDLGGPLVQNGTLVGISSWQISPCGIKEVPSVYTRVSNYVDWITERVTEPLIFN